MVVYKQFPYCVICKTNFILFASINHLIRRLVTWMLTHFADWPFGRLATFSHGHFAALTLSILLTFQLIYLNAWPIGCLGI